MRPGWFVPMPGFAPRRKYRGDRDACVFRSHGVWLWRLGRVTRIGWTLVAKSRNCITSEDAAQRAAERAAKRRGWRVV